MGNFIPFHSKNTRALDSRGYPLGTLGSPSVDLDVTSARANKASWEPVWIGLAPRVCWGRFRGSLACGFVVATTSSDLCLRDTLKSTCLVGTTKPVVSSTTVNHGQPYNPAKSYGGPQLYTSKSSSAPYTLATELGEKQ